MPPSPVASPAGHPRSASPSFLASPECALLDLPTEVLHNILVTVGADDALGLANMARTCRKMRDIIYGTPDQALWRDIHLLTWDDPRKAGAYVEPRSAIDWKRQLQDRTKLYALFASCHPEAYKELATHRDFVAETLLQIALDAPPQPVDHQQPSSGSSDHSKRSESSSTNIVELEGLLATPAFYHLCYHWSKAETQPHLRPLRSQPSSPLRRPVKRVINPVLSRLHAISASHLEEGGSDRAEHRGFLRSLVYSAKNYRAANDWGPFHEDGTVDWALFDAIASVMAANASSLVALGERSWRPAQPILTSGLKGNFGWGFNDLRRPADLGPDEVWDWAGVRGLWLGSYAFLDYADWIELNEPEMLILRQMRSELDLTAYDEAVGDLMHLHFVIDGDEEHDSERTARERSKAPRRPNASLPAITTPLTTSNLLPPIHFHGTARQPESGSIMRAFTQNTFARGVVQLTADNPPEVRWTIVIHYGGEDRWRLECVQMGGRGSRKGLFGTWTAAEKEDHSPNGPVWYFKQ